MYMAADWHVSDSDEEQEGEFHVFKRNPTFIENWTFKSLNVLKILTSHHTPIFECINVPPNSDRSHRKRKRRKTTTEEIGESLFETDENSAVKSTQTTSTGDCRDTRRPTLSAFDYEHEDFINSMLLSKKFLKPKKDSISVQRHKAANLKDIVACLKRDESDTPSNSLHEDIHPPKANIVSNGCDSTSNSSFLNVDFENNLTDENLS
jgi:hypothetical protein